MLDQGFIMARNDPQMNLRVPMELKEKIEKAALDNGRTITAEAVYRLEKSFNEIGNENTGIEAFLILMDGVLKDVDPNSNTSSAFLKQAIDSWKHKRQNPTNRK